MEITFQSAARAKGIKSRGKGKVVYDIHNKKPIVFNGGIFRTTEREQIQDLLHSRLFAEGTIELVDELELVDAYLRGDEPDKLTKDLLKTVNDTGLRKIAKIVGIPEKKHKNYPELLRTMLRGKPVTNMIHKVIESHTTEAPTEDLLEQATEAGIIYRNAPWYKYRKGEEQDPSQDLSLGKSEAEAQQWVAENKEELKQRLKDN